MPYQLAADLAMILHFGWIVFLALGWLIARRILWVRYLHLAALGYSLLLQAFSWVCPLTYVENALRERSSTDSYYSESFIEHYLQPLIYMDINRTPLLIATGLLIALSTVVYYRFGNATKRPRSRPPTDG